MSLENRIIKFCLNRDFFEKNRKRISKKNFTNGLAEVYDVIKDTYKKHENIQKLSVEEIKDAYFTIYKPASTTAHRQKMSQILDNISSDDTEYNEDIISDSLKKLRMLEHAHQVIEEANQVWNGKKNSLLTIKKLVDDFDEDEIKGDEELVPVTKDIKEMLEAVNVTSKWKFNIKTLGDRVDGIGEGNLMIIFARPETGKTAFWVSLTAGHNGFAHQGANVHCFINEEPAVRTQMRMVSAWSDMHRNEIEENMQEAKEEWAKISDKIVCHDSVDWSLESLDKYCEEYKPDIVIVDQLDKINVDGNYNRGDERLRAIYLGAREIAKRRKITIIGMSQASAEAEGLTNLSFDMMENSRTGKAAEADLIIGIGKAYSEGDTPNFSRSLNVLKNKINGWHGIIHTVLVPSKSRYIE
jgi:replicative DNA helicase